MLTHHDNPIFGALAKMQRCVVPVLEIDKLIRNSPLHGQSGLLVVHFHIHFFPTLIAPSDASIAHAGPLLSAHPSKADDQ